MIHHRDQKFNFLWWIFEQHFYKFSGISILWNLNDIAKEFVVLLRKSSRRLRKLWSEYYIHRLLPSELDISENYLSKQSEVTLSWRFHFHEACMLFWRLLISSMVCCENTCDHLVDPLLGTQRAVISFGIKVHWSLCLGKISRVQLLSKKLECELIRHLGIYVIVLQELSVHISVRIVFAWVLR